MTDETRSWTQLRDDNVYLKEQIKQLRITTAKLKRAADVAGQIDGVHLKTVADRAQVYHPTSPVESGIDLEFARHIFQQGVTFRAKWPDNRRGWESTIRHAIIQWKSREK